MITTTTIIQTEFGPFDVHYHKLNGKEFVSFSYGDITKRTPIVRIHSSCLFGEAFHSLHCDCFHQLSETMRVIVKNGNGVIVYAYEEGRGIGLENKIKAMEIERTQGVDTIEAFKQLGFTEPDLRDFQIEAQLLVDLGVSKTIKSFSGNPKKKKALEAVGFALVEELEVDSEHLSQIARKEKQVKKDKMGYSYKHG